MSFRQGSTRIRRGSSWGNGSAPSLAALAAPARLETASDVAEATGALRAWPGRRDDEALQLIEEQACALRDSKKGGPDEEAISRLLALMPSLDADATEVAVGLLRLVSARSRSLWHLDLEVQRPSEETSMSTPTPTPLAMSRKTRSSLPSFAELASRATRPRSGSLSPGEPPPPPPPDTSAFTLKTPKVRPRADSADSGATPPKHPTVSPLFQQASGKEEVLSSPEPFRLPPAVSSVPCSPAELLGGGKSEGLRAPPLLSIDAPSTSAAPRQREASIVCRICETPIPKGRLKHHVVVCEKRNKQDMHVYTVNERIALLTQRLEAAKARLKKADCLSGMMRAATRAQYTDDLLELMAIEFDVRLMNRPCPFIAGKASQLEILIAEKRMALRDRDYDPVLLFSDEPAPPLLLRSPRGSMGGSTPSLPGANPYSHSTSAQSGTLPRHSPRAASVTLSPSDFQVVRPLTRGGFGNVFLVKKRQTGDVFAMKVVSRAMLSQKNAMGKMKTERDILAEIENPFVVKMFYSFTSKEKVFIVMEYLPGGDLFSLLQNLGTLGEDMARFYVAETILALEYLHSISVVHRDIKPDNLLISKTGHIKLVDFGLSHKGLLARTSLKFPAQKKQLSTGTQQSGTSDVPYCNVSLCVLDQSPVPQPEASTIAEGTPDYIPPEALLGLPVGPQADFWSVGCMLFEFLVGVPPFSADTPDAIFDKILRRDIRWPPLSFEAMDLLNRLLTIDPVNRLGAQGAAEIKRHPFFAGVSWDTILSSPAPFVPTLENRTDASFFDARRDVFKISAKAADELAEEPGRAVNEDGLLFVNFGHLAAETQRVSESGEEDSSSSMSSNPSPAPSAT